MPESEMQPGAVVGAVRWWIRLEGLTLLAGCVFFYARGGHSWLLFAALFLAPDLSLLGYLAGPRIGSIVYNVAHSVVLPGILGIAFVALGRPPVLALIWIAHIGFDRSIGYGLKYPSGFGATHLGLIGNRG